MSAFSRDLKSVDEIAEEHNWSTKRVRRLIHEGLPVVQIGRQSLISSNTLNQFLRSREASNTFARGGEHDRGSNSRKSEA